MEQDFHKSEGGHHDGAVHVHVHSIRLYVTVFLVLIALTVLTVATSYIDIDGFIRPGTPRGAGGMNLLLAMAIASTKAFFVVTWFMHLKDDNRFNALVFFGSLVFMGVFFAYTINDTAYRGQSDPYNGVHVTPDTGERAPGGIDHVFPGEEPEEGITPPEAPQGAEAGEHSQQGGPPSSGEHH